MTRQSLVFPVVLAACLALSGPQVTASCLAGYIHHGDNCFKVLNEVKQVSWLEALKECKKAGGTLAEPVNRSATEFLRELAHIYHDMVGLNQWFIGLTDMFVHNQWSFTSSCGQPNYTLWSEDAANDDDLSSTECVVMVWEDGEINWRDVSCTEHKGSSSDPVVPICQVRMDAQTALVNGSSETAKSNLVGLAGESDISCPSQFKGFENHCYYLSVETANFQDASEKCKMKGGALASVHNEAENTFIAGLAGGGSSYAWLGGYHLGWGRFTWEDPTPMDYTNFGRSALPGGTHIQMKIGSDGNQWVAYEPDDQVQYICKIKA